MATTQRSPVLVQHISPPHTLDTLAADVNLMPLPTMASGPPTEQPAVSTPEATAAPIEQSSQTETTAAAVNEESTVQSAAPPVAESDSEAEAGQEAHDAPSEPLNVEHPLPAADTLPNPPESTPVASENIQAESDPPESPPVEPDPVPPPPKPEIPEWVTWEDDTSTPTEEELEKVKDTEENALDVAKIEKKVYEDWEDPEQRPAKKIRLSWVIKGVRGTKERPNMARTMNSPCALVDGHYWQIKFFPRGNKSSSLSAYIRCTQTLPTPDPEVPESTFSYFEGPPDADMGAGAEPKKVLHVAATPVQEEKGTSQTQPDEPGASRDADDTPVAEVPVTQEAQSEATMVEDVKVETPTDDDFRVPAQLGMVIYNPDEPRTCSLNSSEHQFTKHNDDWGWTNFVGPWNEIHTRQPGQRQALLRNDTIAIDAYIRIFDDPSQALWWHVSHDHETIWPSMKLAGYHPMGTPPLYHSPAVAGITAWLLLAPFRSILQKVDAGAWRTNSQIKPRPLIARIQNVLHIMRHLRREDYVNVNPIIDALKECGETFNDVKSFWEVFRRSIEIELEGETDALRQIGEIFDTATGFSAVPTLPVKGVEDVQAALQAVNVPMEIENSPPDFLPLMLGREIFDKKSCEWKLCYDRVTLNDEISLSNGEKYTLYGFMVHVGVRNSGKFYSILRPNGLGTKWLAFEDGDGNKVFSYTRKKIQEYEGLVGDELTNFKSTRQTAYLAMYIKTSCVERYLPGKLEPWSAENWLAAVVSSPTDIYETQLKHALDASDKKGIDVEIYSEEGLIGRRGLLDMHNVKQQSLAKDHFWTFRLFANTTFGEIRRNLASQLDIDNPEKLRLFVLRYGEVGQYNSAQWHSFDLHQRIKLSSSRRPLCLWLSILKSKEDVEKFGIPEDSQEVKPKKKKVTRQVELDSPEVIFPQGTTDTPSTPPQEVTRPVTTVSAAIQESTEAIPPPPSNTTGDQGPPPPPPSDGTPQAPSPDAAAHRVAVVAPAEGIAISQPRMENAAVQPSPDTSENPALLVPDVLNMVVSGQVSDAATSDVATPPAPTDASVPQGAVVEGAHIMPTAQGEAGVEPPAPLAAVLGNISADSQASSEVPNPEPSVSQESSAEAVLAASAPTQESTAEEVQVASPPDAAAAAAVDPEAPSPQELVVERVQSVSPPEETADPQAISPQEPSMDVQVTSATEVSAAPGQTTPTADSAAVSVNGDSILTPVSTPQEATLDPSQPVPEAATTETADPVPEEAPAVEHGHLFDAVMSDAPPVVPTDAAAVIEQTIASVQEVQTQAAEQTNDAVPPPEPEPPQSVRPVPNVYGFLQVFDADEQDFVVHSTFFGKRDESAKEVVRRCMGYDTDKQFHAWHRETTLDGSSIDSKATFEDINFSDGVDIVVGQVLSDSKKEQLRQQGKFSSPFALSRYLRMSERKHPIQARTTSEAVEIADFGMNYFKGPLVNGQPHGEKCLMITAHGHTYEGPLVMNEKSGAKGKMTYQNGDVYEGEWKNDERDGQGTFVEKRTGNRYEGGFQNGKRWGKGVTHWQVADQEADMCQICYIEEKDALFFDCGHVCSCVECAKQCEVCPICRRAVKQVVRMFWA